MGKIFNMDNPFFSAMGRVADLFLLNLVFLVCCIPFVTIGPALTAMFYVTLKMVKNEESYIFRSFFHSFRENLKQGIIIHLIMTVVAVILFLDFYITASMSGTFIFVLRILLLVICVFCFLIYLYIYPILSKFCNPVKNTFKNALLMAIIHLPKTILLAVIALCPIVVFFIPSAQLQSTIFFLLIIIGPAAIAFFNSKIFVKIFEKYIPEEPDNISDEIENPDFGVYDSVMASPNAPTDLSIFSEKTENEDEH